MQWYHVKQLLEHSTGFSMDALHVLVGVILQLMLCLLLRRTLADPLPWSGVLLVELVNELNDLSVEVWPDRWIQYAESLKDIILTLLLPSLLLFAVRLRPGIFRR